ncbi:MAG: hypothetical protein M3N22_03885 [Acidobacteriota bacterium]|nr:hypothetical protein [Acidobacteriota bacterium]
MMLLVVLGGSNIRAQSVSPGSNSSSKTVEGFTPGWTLGTRFEGSTSGDGTVLDLGSAVGYIFSNHFGIDAGVPYYFVGSSASIKKNNPNAVSGTGLGSLFSDLKLNLPGKTLNYNSTIHLTAPTGDMKKGFSTGHATWNFGNHFEHGFNNFTPFVDLGVGNTVIDTKYFHRPFTTFGYNAQFEAGSEFDAGKFNLTASAYDVAPWGPQTVVSKVFRCSSGAKCSANGKTTDRRGYVAASVESGSAALVRDNGFNAGVEFKPVPLVDLEFDYSRSVPLRLNSFSFGISLDLSRMLISPSRRRAGG